MQKTTLQSLRKEIRAQANAEKAALLQGFFKTGPGEYGQGDVFIGLTVPMIRKLVKECDSLPGQSILRLLHSRIHEERMLALLILVRRYEKGNEPTRCEIYKLYLANTAHINNWDLVDLSAPNIVGRHLLNRSRAPLRRLARSRDLWQRRIAILATFTFIRENQFDDALTLADTLLHDKHDLIHKATGWMLREIGKRDLAVEEAFLLPRYNSMPRTMLRYAIERFPEPRRQQYLKGNAA